MNGDRLKGQEKLSRVNKTRYIDIHNRVCIYTLLITVHIYIYIRVYIYIFVNSNVRLRNVSEVSRYFSRENYSRKSRNPRYPK